MSSRTVCVVLLALAASACRTPEASAPAMPPLTHADLVAAERHESPFTLEFDYQSLPHGAIRSLRIGPDGSCKGAYHGMAHHEMVDGERAGELSSADRRAILATLRDAPFERLAPRAEHIVMDGAPVRLSVEIGGRRLVVDRQMSDFRAAGLEPLCRLLVDVLARLPRT